MPDNKILQIQIDYEDKVKNFGGMWNKEKKVWELAYKFVKSLSLNGQNILLILENYFFLIMENIY